MTKDNMDHLAWLRKVLAKGDADLMPEMLKVFAEELMALKADAVRGAAVKPSVCINACSSWAL